MGAPKPLLAWRGESFLAHAVAALRDGGCDRVMTVVGAGPEADAIAAEAVRLGSSVAVNPLVGAEQIASLRVALDALPRRTEAAVVTPVDLPAIRADTVRALIAAFRHWGDPIVLPTVEGEHGHPALFAAAVWPELRADPLPEGARTVIHADPRRVREVPTADPAVLHDVDTPADLARLPGELPR